MPGSENQKEAMETSEYREYLWHLLNMVSEWIRHAEAKLGVTLAFVGAGVPVLVQLGRGFSEPNWFIKLFEALVLLSAMASAGCCLWGLNPRTKKHARNNEGTFSPIYFHDIYDGFTSPEELGNTLSQTLNRTQVAFSNLIIQQVFENSRVAAKKFYWAKLALRFLMSEIVFLLALVVVFIVKV